MAYDHIAVAQRSERRQIGLDRLGAEVLGFVYRAPAKEARG
jgi:hypothetical protein